MPEDGIEYESFTIISVHSLLVYKYYLQVYLDNFAYKIVNSQMVDYCGDYFWVWWVFDFINMLYKYCIMHDISKSDAINLIENSVLKVCRYI